MVSLTPFLLFDGNCAEAMRFYQSCLGGELSITEMGGTPMGGDLPAATRATVAYARLRSGVIELSATDWRHPTRAPRPGNTVAMYLSGGVEAELRELFDRLSEGADAALRDDLREMPFGLYGHLADRYGVHWFFQGGRPAPAR